MEIQEKLQQICGCFKIYDPIVASEHIKVGNVNQTYKVTVRRPDGRRKSYIIQNVNTYAFKHPEQIMHNIDLVTEYIHQKKPGLAALHYHHTPDRKTYVIDESGFWRLCNYFDSMTYDNVDADAAVLRRAGEAFGDFQLQLADFEPALLYETIPDFHNTVKRLDTLFADAERDPLGRGKEVGKELAYIASVREEACQLVRMQENGVLPVRVTHNDTKINNVLFDRVSGDALVVIDLDTVMPGLAAYDFGDAIRFAANRVAEDSPDWQRAGCDFDVFRTFTEGFLSKTADMLTPAEIGSLAISPFVMALEVASRFLDDYLVGDLYFKTDYPTHNLVRTRCQLALARDFYENRKTMDRIIRGCAGSVPYMEPVCMPQSVTFTV